ncbi:MAG TPA: CheR family methyltransferase [Bacteroidota bacterium]|nr:CheR family methyltransferase [Bacteroidota bacterium]
MIIRSAAGVKRSSAAQRVTTGGGIDESDPAPWHDLQELTHGEFAALTDFVRAHTGIALSQAKRSMIQARLQKRLRALSMQSFSEYCAYLFSPEGTKQELGAFINVVTTNKTDFFREPHHFEYLVRVALPWLETHGMLHHRLLRVWSAACSSGQEPYTLGMVLSEYGEQSRGFTWSVLGTDISTKVLESAIRAIYREEDVAPIPLATRKKFLLRGKRKLQGLVRIEPKLCAHVTFRRLNFMDKVYSVRGPFEIIFFRNAIIYFDKATQYAILSRLTEHLVTGGFLFLGHSESLNGMTLPYVSVATTVYQKTGTMS